MSNFAELNYEGKLYQLPVIEGSEGEKAIDISKLRSTSGLITIDKGFKNRTLPYFKQGDLSPRARGFIRNNFKSGLSPDEFFFGAMTGRDSLMDTALRTPKSGYLYRRLSNAMQDLKVEYDQTVRDANKRISQFKFGDDGLDVSKTEGGIINVKKIIKEVTAK